MSCVSEGEHAFRSDVQFDTVVTIGHADERSPLLLFEAPMGAQFLEDTLILFRDSGGRHLTAVNPETEEGWQVGGQGRSGPGEFGDLRPTFTESGGRIYTALRSRQASIRSIEGELLSTPMYSEYMPNRGDLAAGILTSGILVGRELDPLDWNDRETQHLGQRIVGYSYEGREWVFDDLPMWSTRVEEYEEGKTRTTEVDGQVRASARHGTVVLSSNRASWIAALNADGSLRRRIETGGSVYNAFVDADERIWAWMWASNSEDSGSYIVFDRRLNVLDSVIAGSVRDAKGDRILTVSVDESTGVTLLHVLQRRRQ